MSINELKIYFDLSLDSKSKVLDRYTKKFYLGGYFFVDSENGQCYLFDRYGEEKDVSLIHEINEGMIPKDIQKIVIPNSVTRIGYWAFENCYGLTGVTIPDHVTSIECGAFSGCCGLTSVTIPDSVTSIGSSVFQGCNSLISVTIPNRMTYIGFDAFHDCNNLKSLIFKNMTKDQVKAMYPFGIEDESIIKCELS